MNTLVIFLRVVLHERVTRQSLRHFELHLRASCYLNHTSDGVISSTLHFNIVPRGEIAPSLLIEQEPLLTLEFVLVILSFLDPLLNLKLSA